MRQFIRYGIAATVAVLSASGAATGARAGEWCGYTTHDNAVIECGYTSVAGCESAVGKGGMCFVDPDTALNIRRATPAGATKLLRVLEQETGRG
jgi:hypothetical protein